MADFTALKTAIQTYIKENGNEEITGEKLQEILLSMVTILGDSAINDLITALNDEVAARQNADGTLQQNITNEAILRGNADTALGGRIDDEATARGYGDTALSERLGSSITTENTAADQIGAEAEARAAADTALQDLIDGITENIENGYVYAGIATPSSTPATGKVFYLALTEGTYTNFGSTVVSQGINILKYNGSAWSLDAFIGIDDEPTPSSTGLPKSGGTFDFVIKNGSAFDISAHFASGGTLATYADLSAALAALDTLPAAYKRGGMVIRYVDSSDNNYVQYRYMPDDATTVATFTDVANWQGVDATPTAGSKNLVESGGADATITNGAKIVPCFDRYINIDSTNVTIPALTRIITGNGYVYRVRNEEVVRRAYADDSGINQEIILFNSSTHGFAIINSSTYNKNSYPCSTWYVVGTIDCAKMCTDLPAMYTKINGEFYYAKESDVSSFISTINAKDYSVRLASANSTVIARNVSLVKGKTYKFRLFCPQNKTVNETFTFKVMSTSSESALFTIAQLEGVALQGWHEWTVKWALDGGDYRIGFFTPSITYLPIQFYVEYEEQVIVSSDYSTSEDYVALSTKGANEITNKIVYNSLFFNGTSIGDMSRIDSTNWYIAGSSTMEVGKEYRITMRIKLGSGTRYKNHIIVSKYNDSNIDGNYQSIGEIYDTTSPADTIKELTVNYTCIDDGYIYIGYWRQNGGGDTTLVGFHVDFVGYIKDLREEVNAIEGEVDDLKEEVDDLKRKDTDVISYKNVDFVFAAKRNCNTFVKDDRGIDKLLSICHITDVHTDWRVVKRAAFIAEHTNSTLICTGDITLQSSGENVDGYNNIIENYNGKYLHCVGNHDVWSFSSPQAEYEKWFEKYINDYNMPWVMPTGINYPSYFVHDDSDWNIRYIMLDQWRRTGTDDNYNSKYTQEQIDFLISALSTVPASYGVIIVMHALEKNPVPANGFTKFYIKGERMSGGTVKFAPVAAIVDAFISKTTLSTTMTSDNESVTINADFTNVASNEFIAYISGHVHQDLVHYVDGTTNLQLVLNETCSNHYYSENPNVTLAEASDIGRDNDGYGIDAFNVYVIDRAGKKVRIVRIGADMPFDFSEPRNYMIIPYKV